MERLERALGVIDEANSSDPSSWNGEPLALVQGRLAHGWVMRLEPAASAPLQIAARAHHLRRWTLPRASYPDGRAGYLRWRRDQAVREARELVEILTGVGFDPAAIERATTILRKVGLGSDAEVQVFEDAVCLTFVETQLGSSGDRLAGDRLVGVVVKTLAKMSVAGRDASVAIQLDETNAALLRRAIDEFDSPTP